jgi:transposase
MAAIEPMNWSNDEPPRRERRRKFSAEYKARIVREAAACTKRGELGALLRREGLYPSHLASFRNAAIRALKGTFATEPRTSKKPSIKSLSLQLARQERELQRWKKRAERAEVTVRLQKKFSLRSDSERRARAPWSRSWPSSARWSGSDLPATR